MCNNLHRLLCILGLCAMLGACFSAGYRSQSGGIFSGEVRDSGPEKPVSVDHIPDAVPRHEPRTKAGNTSPYTVLGRTYRVMDDSTGFKQRGVASWYGRKFHGRRTANGEIYNMYGMTAAHTTLPIPSFVKVKNLANGRTVVVRVNDRGPFYGDRIIDLTYTAAKKLGFAERGTAQVEVEVVTANPVLAEKVPPVKAPPISAQPQTEVAMAGLPSSANVNNTGGESPAPTPVNAAGYQLPGNTFLQVGAFSTEDAAMALQKKIAALTKLPVVVRYADATTALFRVRIGPILDNWELLNLSELLKKKQLSSPHIVYD